MKKTLFILFASSTIFISCSKEDDASPQQQNVNSNITTQQDSALISTWTLDSLQIGSDPVSASGGMSKDSLFITSSLFIHNLYFNGNFSVGFENQWETSGDSVFCKTGENIVFRYQYSVTPGHLFLYKKSSSSDNTKCWYHKAQ